MKFGEIELDALEELAGHRIGMLVGIDEAAEWKEMRIELDLAVSMSSKPDELKEMIGRGATANSGGGRPDRGRRTR